MQNFKYEMLNDNRRSKLVWILMVGVFGFILTGAAWAQTNNSGGAGSSSADSPPPMARPGEGGNKSHSMPPNKGDKDSKRQTPQRQNKGTGGCKFRSNDLGLIA